MLNSKFSKISWNAMLSMDSTGFKYHEEDYYEK